MKYCIGIIFILLIGLYFFLYIRSIKKYRTAEKEFIKYLYSISDTDTLYGLGIIDKDGIKERRAIFYSTMDDKLWEKYKQTKDERYLDFGDEVTKYFKSKIAFFVLLAVTSIVFGILGEYFS
ncbi:hypothetical protein FACS189485_15700 [Spirochaetia bacterium]|nr:hypothetical protein FACS189485_15700 [Spirochaetia bacterium]